MDESVVERMVRDFQDRITPGTWQGVCAIDEASRDKVLECQAASCVRAYAELYQIPRDLDLDTFLEKMQMGGSSKIEIERRGDEILWTELHEGRCVCPLVTRGVIPLGPASSAYGYGQVQRGTWDDYRRKVGRPFARRDRFEDAVDFVGWYADVARCGPRA